MSREISVAAFRAYFGNLFADPAEFPESWIEEQLEEAKIEVCERVFRQYYRRALFYLTAHFLTLFHDQQKAVEVDSTGASASAARGTISSVSVGDLSLSQEMPEYSSNSDDRFLASTIYGQEFIRLRNKMSRGPLLANQPLPKNPCVAL